MELEVSGGCVPPDTVLIVTFHSETLTIKIRRHKKKKRFFLHETAAREFALDGRGQDLPGIKKVKTVHSFRG